MKCLKLNSKEKATYCFKQNGENTRKWTCVCGTQREQNGTGYAKLMNQITRAHEKYEEAIREDKRAQKFSSALSSVVVSKQARNLWAWLVVMIDDLKPFNYVEKPFKKRNMKMDPIFSETLVRYRTNLTEIVERKIDKKLPSIFALIFYGWSVGSYYYIAILLLIQLEKQIGIRVIFSASLYSKMRKSIQLLNIVFISNIYCSCTTNNGLTSLRLSDINFR